MKEFSKYVGLDVHKETIAVSVAETDGGEVRYLGEIANTPEAVAKRAAASQAAVVGVPAEARQTL
jgi:methylmalonyl-CoA mutase cobalamin-binding subunit